MLETLIHCLRKADNNKGNIEEQITKDAELDYDEEKEKNCFKQDKL